MKLFQKLFKRNVEESVESVAEPVRNSYKSERGPLRVIRLSNPVTGEFFELDLNDDDAFDRFVKSNQFEDVVCCGRVISV